MEAMLGISLYSCPYLKQQKLFVFLIIAYVFSSTKLEKRAEQFLPGSEGSWGETEGMRGRGRNDPKKCVHILIRKKKNTENCNMS
jgi:hypothetical protein